MVRRSLLICVVLVAGCGSSATSVAPSASAPAGDPEGAWELAAGELDGVALRIRDDHPVTLVIDGSRISGRSACNEYGGRIDPAPAGVVIGELSGTDMACAPEELMALEAAYLAALRRVRSVGVVEDALAMRGDGVDLRFDRQPEVPVAELVDTTWVLETIFIGDIASAPDGDAATLELRSDGTFSGATGCRTFSGRWVEDGAQIRAPDLRMGDMECPTELASQDSHVVSVIGDGFVPSVDGDLLTLLDPGGVGLVYRAAE